uniref:Mating fator 3.1 n=1 Tax=Ustilago esculenta TaxID=185366 RepID=A0A0U2YCU3_9BASI|nr:mating fator 3.1 [Ustilago esculenta]QBH70103.1 mating fator 3.1 [Ustilago esculenta]
MFTIFETVSTAVQAAISVAEHEQAPQNEGRGQLANYCVVA